MRVNTLVRSAPPAARMAARARRHVRRVGVVADHLQREIGFDARRRYRTRRHGTAASRRARPGFRADRPPICACSAASIRSRKCSSRTYSAGMVASASSSNTQWPSGCLAAAQGGARRARSRSSRSRVGRSMGVGVLRSRGLRGIGGDPGRDSRSMCRGSTAGPDGTFDGGGQPGGGPVAGERQVRQSGGGPGRRLLRGGGGEGRALLLNHPAAAASCRAAQRRRTRARPCRRAPRRCGRPGGWRR